MATVYRSKFGGLWTDRQDSLDVLVEKRKTDPRVSRLDEEIAFFIQNGYVVLRGVVPTDKVDAFSSFFDAMWDNPPAGLTALIHTKGGTESPHVSPEMRDKPCKVVNLHEHHADGYDLVLHPVVTDFLAAIYERPPTIFQSMAFRFGSQQPIHLDTAYLALTEPMSMMASWVPLQDIEEGSGELIFYPGSHRVRERLYGGVSKSYFGYEQGHTKLFDEVVAECEAKGIRQERFLGKRGDVLLWTSDFAHGGAKITKPGSLRRSLVSHYMPLGVRPTWYDNSNLKFIPYGPAAYKFAA